MCGSMVDIKCLSYFHTMMSLSANLESEMCCTWLTGNTGRKNGQKFAILAPSYNLSGHVVETEECVDNRKKVVKQQSLPHMSPQYGELRPICGSDLFASLGHPRKFQRVSCLGSVTARHSSSGRQPNFARCLTVSWAGILDVHVRGLLPANEIL